MVELRALGAIDLRRDGTEVAQVLAQPKRTALLLFLNAAHPYGFHRRDRIMRTIWPELDESQSRDALNEAINAIRRELGENAITTRGEDVMLDPVYIRSDVRVLDAAIENTDHMRVVQLFQGPLADGFSLGDAPEFEQWLNEERLRIRNNVADSAWALAEKSRDAGRNDDAAAFARSAAALMRDDEESVRRLMLFLGDSGDNIGALRAYDEFALWLASEKDADPDPDTDALRDRIRDGEPLHEGSDEAAPSGVSSSSDSSSPPESSSTTRAPAPAVTADVAQARVKSGPLWLPWAAVGVAAAALLLLLASVLST